MKLCIREVQRLTAPLYIFVEVAAISRSVLQKISGKILLSGDHNIQGGCKIQDRFIQV